MSDYVEKELGLNAGTLDMAGGQHSLTVYAGTEICAFTNTANCQAGGVPSNPALESGSLASPSLQALLTLNISVYDPNSANLSYLLAGLLDNSTGGVNGTFRDETQNLSFLGLAAPVMDALANGVWDSGGIFGAPVSYGQPNPPSPPGCSGFLGCVWNAVSGVVVGIAGAVYGAVWTAVQAATQFMKQLGAGLAHLAEEAEQAAISTLEAVGSVLEAALQALLAFVKDAIVTFLRQTFASLSNEMTQLSKAYASPVFRPEFQG